ncbi:hypothetical protein [Algisphaera agarilytica]|nr:hypothetical protein [Algisphaera agarilytica]
MSAELLQKLREQHAIDAAELADLFNISTGAGYNYFGRSSLSFEQFRTLFRRAKADAVREVFLANLLQGLPCFVQWVDSARDINGDGVVDTNDALKAGIDQMARSAETVRRLHSAVEDGRIDHGEAEEICFELDHLISEAVITRNIVNELKKLNPPRRKCVRRPVGLHP